MPGVSYFCFGFPFTEHISLHMGSDERFPLTSRSHPSRGRARTGSNYAQGGVLMKDIAAVPSTWPHHAPCFWNHYISEQFGSKGGLEGLASHWLSLPVHPATLATPTTGTSLWHMGTTPLARGVNQRIRCPFSLALKLVPLQNN